MCQQSLINYLATELEGKTAKEDIEALIHTGEQVSENEATALLKEKMITEGRQKTTKNKPVLPESIKNNAALIDNKLEEITVCDPAVGSGAFPVGMMSEIVKARNVLSVFLNDKDLSACNVQAGRTTYEFKRTCIERSLYGVDIDPGAVEIAKLRLWLSLVVDEDDIKNIKPLPNLDYKVVCGNSLLGVEKNLFNLNFFNKLEKLKPLFFNETNPTKKQEYRVKIDDLISKITNGHREFDFEVYFSEVFHEKGGFDVVIANPPWGIKVNEEQQVKLSFRVNKSLDSSEYFILRSEQLMYPLSVLTFIVPKSMIFANNWTTSRKYLLERIIIDVADAGITFENVNLESFVFVVKNTKNTDVVNKVIINKFEPVKKYAPIKVLHRLPCINQNVMCKADSIILADLCSVSKSIIYKIQKSDQFLDSIPREVFRGLYIPDSVKEKILDKGLGLYVNKVPDVGLYTIKRVRNIDLSKIIRTKEKTLKNLNRNRIIVKVLRGKKLTCTFVERGILTTEKLVNLVLKDANYSYFFILGLLNSSLTSFYFAKAVFSDITETSRVMDDCYLSKAPIKKLNSKEQKPFISIVEKILAMTDDEDYLQNPKKQNKVKTLEAEIDQLVYKLYDLAPEEIKIVEGENEISD